MTKKTVYDFSTNKVEVIDFTTEEQKAFDAQKPNAEKQLATLRSERNFLLSETDWWASSDLTMTDAQKKYRQDLRDITKTYQSLSDKDFKFPTKPTE
jgi:hypothetical protein